MTRELRADNLAFLSAKFPQLAERIQNHLIPPGEIRPTLIQGENGVFTASVEIGSQTKFLHSKYDPIREAQRWATSQTPPPGSVVLIVGWGLGYHAIEWIKAHGQAVEAVIIFEPEPELFKSSLFCVDLRPLAAAKRLEMIVGCDAAAFDRALQSLIEPLLNRDLSLLPLPFVDIYPTKATAFLKNNLQKMLARREGVLRHMAEMGARCQENIIRNIPATAEAFFPRDVRGIAAGQPAIIVAAGPSLDRNVDSLPQAQGRAWIFSVDTSLRILQRRGVEAQFAVVKDPTDRNRSHFEGLENLDRPALIFDPQIAPDIPPRFAGAKICTPNRNRELHRYLDGLSLTPNDPLPHSTNVAIAAFNIAALMGCDPIIFTGLDFCFSRGGGSSHAADSALRSDTQYDAVRQSLLYRRGEAQEEISIIEVAGIDGLMHPTSPNFYESLRLLESLIQKSSARCIDASEGGAKIAGTEMKTLEQALREECSQPINYSSFHSLARPSRDRGKIKASLEKIADHIERCGIAAQRAAEELSEWSVGDIPASVQKARREIEAEYRLYRELQSALERLLVDVSRPDFWEMKPQNRNEWLARFVNYFNTVEATCAYFAPIYREIALDL